MKVEAVHDEWVSRPWALTRDPVGIVARFSTREDARIHKMLVERLLRVKR